MTISDIEKLREEIGSYKNTDIRILIFRVHRLLKNNFDYVSDDIQYPQLVKEIWDVWKLQTKKITTIEDCDGFTLKYLYLMMIICEVPTDRLYFVGAFAFTGEGHAIPMVKDQVGMMWQCDNMLISPVPAWWMFNGVGCVSDIKRGLGEMMKLSERGKWREFLANKLPQPREVKGWVFR